jgi:hypothetical protein
MIQGRQQHHELTFLQIPCYEIIVKGLILLSLGKIDKFLALVEFYLDNSNVKT